MRKAHYALRTTHRALKVISADFVTSAAAGGALTGIPSDRPPALDSLRAALRKIEGPQIALAGRSNVGKSTLINALCRRRVARTSAAPGKTRLVNVYRVVLEGLGPGRLEVYLVDLPGYGYVRGGPTAAEELRAVAEGYFGAWGLGARGWGLGTGGARAALLLVDSRHPGLAADIRAHDWLRTFGIEPIVVATKIDKLTRAERVKNLKELERTFGTAVLPVSAERGEGLDELWRKVARTVRATKDRR